MTYSTMEYIEILFSELDDKEKKEVLFERLIPYLSDLNFFGGLQEIWHEEDKYVGDQLTKIIEHLRKKEV